MVTNYKKKTEGHIMKYNEKIILKNGKECILRHATEEDAKTLKEHRIVVAGETDYLSRYPDEMTMTVEEEARTLERKENSFDELMMIAEIDGKLVGNSGIYPVGPYDRLKHKANFGVSIKKAYWGMGIGTIILNRMLMIAKEAGYEMMNLEVIEGNASAIRMYERYGFHLFGKEEKGFRYRDGSYATIYHMHREL